MSGFPDFQFPGAPMTEQELLSINPTRSLTNCNECAKALDDFLAGNGLTPALDAVPHSPYDLEQLYPGRQFQWMGKSEQDIVQQLQTAGPGSRGIVYGSRAPGSVPDYGHVFNAVNYNGRVLFIDAQKGGEAIIQGYNSLEFLRTG